MSFVDVLFSAKGRMRRRDYWIYSLSVTAAFFIAGYAVHAFIGTDDFISEITSAGTMSPTPFHYFMFVVQTLGQWPAICIMAKRWHDRNKSGWLALITTTVLLVLDYAPRVLWNLGLPVPVDGWFANMCSLFDTAIVIWIFVECGCLDGTKGPNKYGPSPKGIGVAEDVF
ncbi:DUF805 domain-containing protein [Asticcacaulis sp. BYS171W]|uniref:DUF805 domain-containing protein n=1 Tax=Asticcacaulis aquaticus TaxID=2984212 RepID=A0ABT5HPW6_9CAUL|nr:DUF805 domain-containing protein [Asticcacaulis aquaticus]MDC7681982.1 DUF805 domain-containing protein [Asticcacaulis aquaticus]